MHIELMKEYVKSVRLRVSQGDCPTEQPISREGLEDLVVELASALDLAVTFLREGKAKFAPGTTNSFVDEFLQRHVGGDK